VIRYRALTQKAAREYFGPLTVFAVRAEEYGHAALRNPLAGEYIPTEGEDFLVQAPLVLTDVHVIPSYRRRGVANEMVRRCLAYADQRQITVCARVCAYSHGVRLKVADLVCWYEGHGFRHVDTINGEPYMVRPV
jgi:ribosomal protein S18 acetylase RimI-like enzyme